MALKTLLVGILVLSESLTIFLNLLPQFQKKGTNDSDRKKIINIITPIL